MKLATRDFGPQEEALDASVEPGIDGVEAGSSRGSAYPISAQPPLQQFIGILRRRIWLILGVAMLGSLLVGIIALLLPPKYTAKALIIVEPQQSALANGQVVAGTAADQPTIDTQVTMLSSFGHVQRVLASLSKDPAFQVAVREIAGARGEAAAEISDRKDKDTPAAAQEAPAFKPMSLSLEDFERYLRVSQERSSRVISVSFTARDPEKAAIIANRVVELYVESQGEQKRSYASGELAELNRRIAEIKVEVEQSASAVHKSIQQRYASGQVAPADGGEAEMHLRELEREAALRDQLYANLLRRQKEIRYQQEVVVPDVRILSFASPPERPSSTNPLLFVFPAFLIFALGGCWLAVAVERLDRGMRSEQDVKEALGIACVGHVPELSRTSRNRPHRYLLKHPYSTYAEAMRSIVVGLELTSAAPPKVILTSSSVPLEGKTRLSLSLAVYLATLRRRVLLVDLDFRHPSVLGALRAKAKRGVLDVLLYDLPPADVIQRLPDLGLDYLPMTLCTVDPLSLFAGDRLQHMFDQLRASYDCIIVDGPPLLGVTEARLLASMADRVLFIVKWASTRREVAQNAVNILRGAGCFDEGRAPPCAALTQVNLKEHARYRYGDIGEFFVNHKSYYPRSGGPGPFRMPAPPPQPAAASAAEPSTVKVPDA